MSNRTEEPGPRPDPAGDTLQRFLHHARSTPDAPAVEDETGRLGYAELLAAARRRAAELAAAGAGRGSRIAIESAYGTDYLVALLATWLLGAVAVPLDPASPADRRRYQIRQARCDAAAVGPRSDGVVERAVAECTATDRDTTRDRDTADPAAYILFTSGSTGVPKGVEVGHPGLANLLDHFVRVLPLGAGDRMLAHSSTIFDMSVPELLLPLVSGGVVAVAPPRSARNPEFFANWLRAHPVAAAWATPSQLRLLLPYLRGERVFGTLISGGEALTAALAEELRPVTGRLWNAYGPTEITVVGLATEVTPPFTDPMPIGLPLTGLGAHVLDEELRPVPTGTVGELCLSGVGLARGYVGSPEQTARAFVTGPGDEPVYRTGDLVRVRADGRYCFHGRRDDQVKIRGHRVELGEIETVAQRSPAIAQASALVSELPNGRAELYLAVAPARDTAAGPGELRDHLRRLLPTHMQPQRVLLFPELPRNTAGKTDRRAVRQLVEDHLRAN
ncbi:amino acid adenylation domain-containing protein [Kitasatospora sp. NPDC052896]|uniref:amino acid adenylation domain-containing protein n=1 Tax=Kitasatospora sp. NPDC052896 TaxID=3364061 RepID=UPI0037C555A8